MTNLNLEPNEGIILETYDAWRYDGNDELGIDDFVLTNKNLIYTYEKSNGFFSKKETICQKIPLTSIAIINGIVQANQIKDREFGDTLQITFTNGVRELFCINVSPKKEHPKWATAITNAVCSINGIEPQQPVQPATPTNEAKEKLFAGAAAIGSMFKGAVDTAKETVSQVVSNVQENTTNRNQTIQQPQISQPQTTTQSAPMQETTQVKLKFCINCGTKLQPGAKFCFECGTKTNEMGANETPPVPVQAPPPVVSTERRQEFSGKVFKCPNCGSPINETSVICPSCGMQITGRAAVSSVQQFKDQLMEIESQRKRRGFSGVLNLTADPVDNRKLSLIRSFPIPNTIDDIIEFMMLAIANIDVSLSKKTAFNKYNSSLKTVETNQTIPKTISDAWVSKMQQAYQKAEMLFPNEPAFQGIQKIYFDKMKELKIKIN